MNLHQRNKRLIFKDLLDKSILTFLKRIQTAILRIWNEIYLNDLNLKRCYLLIVSRVLNNIDLVTRHLKNKQLRASVTNLEWFKIIVLLKTRIKMIRWEQVTFLLKILKSTSIKSILRLDQRLIMINYLLRWGITTCIYSNYETNTSLRSFHL